MFNHYVAVDWAMSNMAIARMTAKSNKITTIDVPSDIKEMQIYLNNLQGSVCLTFEETTTARWLYTELKDCVDRIIVCDPYRNKLLSEGAKTDKIDAEKLVKLLRADLLKEVFQSNDKFIEMRKIVSAYGDLIQSGVRLKNQRSALFRGCNKNHKKEVKLQDKASDFVLQGLDEQISGYELEKNRYQKEFSKLTKQHFEIKRLSEIPGIGEIGAIKIISRVVDAHRFATKNKFLSYCGLVKHEKLSGGKSYGKKNPRCSRLMKSVFKFGALATIHRENQFGEQYNYLLEKKKYSERNARNAISRQIAAVVYGTMKSGKKYDSLLNKKLRREKENEINKT